MKKELSSPDLELKGYHKVTLNKGIDFYTPVLAIGPSISQVFSGNSFLAKSNSLEKGQL